MKTLFGTDGVRGRANVPPMTSGVALRIGMSVAHRFRHANGSGRIVIGKDTRLSGYMFETALASGITAMGLDVQLVGPLPTPAIAFLTHQMRADAGVVISASHNPYEDNGIKVFDRFGYKLPDAVEMEIEAMALSDRLDGQLADAASIGKAFRIDDAGGRYISHLKHRFPAERTLEGMTLAIDCAHGAAYRIAPLVLEELGARTIALGVRPDGRNINDGVGSLHPETIRRAVLEHGAQLGIALDGDADRVVFCDEHGVQVDGDAVIAAFALHLKAAGRLRDPRVVATVMSNMGLARALEAGGIGLVTCDVGDRYVTETLRREGLSFGGENSGHLIFLEHATTGDGLLAALQMLAILLESGRPLSEIARTVDPLPARLTKVRVAAKPPLEGLAPLQAAIGEARRQLGRYGKVLVRYSGTEPVARVLVEGEDAALVERWAEQLRGEVERGVGGAAGAEATA